MSKYITDPILFQWDDLQLCRTSPTGGWKQGGGYLGNGSTMYLHHELCSRNWEHPRHLVGIRKDNSMELCSRNWEHPRHLVGIRKDNSMELWSARILH